MPGLLKRIVRGFLLLVVGFYLLCLLGLVYLRFFPPLVTTVQLQRQVEALFGAGEYRRQYSYVPRERIAPDLRRAVVAAEDTRFYQHRGFDWEEFRKARREAERRGEQPRGASTITQQLVKNLFLTTHRSVLRKGLEYTLTPLAELILPKERILELYLNVIEWGPGVFGAEAAAQHHYNVPAARLTRQQATRLAAIVPAPRTRKPQQMGWYADIIQRRMRQMGW
ncbi:MAG TPA: monofunctional biosynthetic peptidoglycan transglycosylase [Longimicrobiaceae bacterium]|nr:monofunctional biosynthetic peptidoglycan transglycosylase [Longimicrobiaceae bacterium]